MLHREAIIVYQACTVIVVCQTVEFQYFMAAESSSYRPSPTRRLSNAPSGKTTGGFCLSNSALVMYHGKSHVCDTLYAMYHMLAKAYQITYTRRIWQQAVDKWLVLRASWRDNVRAVL